jgi:quinol monooxygenase YgiN
MTTNYKLLKLLLVLSFVIAIFSFRKSMIHNTQSKKAALSSKNTNADFTPFDIVEITHTVKDYAAWKPLFESDSVARKASGLQALVVGRAMDNPNTLLVVLQASDIQKAKDFASNPRLKDAMEKGGVISKPDVQYEQVIRFNPDSKENQWVEVSHRVKDFDAWLKVFDEEGTEARAQQGLIDVVVARNVDDPNVVKLVFDIKDMAKAKASIFSEEKKKLMISAGVISKPKIEFYTTAE